MSIQIKQAQSPAELQSLFSLRYKVFIKECRYNLPNNNQKIYDFHDHKKQTINLIASKNNKIIAGVRLISLTPENIKTSSPLFNFTKILNQPNINLSLGSNFVIAKNYRNYFLCAKLLNKIHQLALKLNYTHIAAVVSPNFEPICLKYGYQPLGPKYKLVSSGLIIRPVLLDLAKNL